MTKAPLVAFVLALAMLVASWGALAAAYHYSTSDSNAYLTVERSGCAALAEKARLRAVGYYEAANIHLLNITCPGEFGAIGSSLTLGYTAYDKNAGIYNAGTWATYTLASIYEGGELPSMTRRLESYPVHEVAVLCTAFLAFFLGFKVFG